MTVDEVRVLLTLAGKIAKERRRMARKLSVRIILDDLTAERANARKREWQMWTPDEILAREG